MHKRHIFRTPAGQPALGTIVRWRMRCTWLAAVDQDQDRSGRRALFGTPWLQCICRVSAAETVK